MSKELRQSLEQFRHELESVYQQRRMERLAQLKLLEEDTLPGSTRLLSFTPSADVAALLADIRAAVQLQVGRYAPAPAEGEAPAPIAAVLTIGGPYTQLLRSQLGSLLNGPAMGLNGASMSPGTAIYASLLEEELASLTTAIALQGSLGPALVPKLKIIQQALLAQRYTDALTLLKTLQRSDPHNHLVLFLLGQLLYLLVGQGQQGALPEARDTSQRSTILSDRLPADKLWRYRIQAAVAEALHDPERTLGILRDSGLLAVELMAEDWSAHGAVGLMAWALLADIPVSLWGEQEFNALAEIVNNAPGGALLYLMWFRQPLIEAASQRKSPLPKITEIEKNLQLAWTLYSLAAAPLHELKMQKMVPPWTVRMRYLYNLTEMPALPGFDHVLLHVALSGHSWHAAPPDVALRETMENTTNSYWRLWALAITYERELRQNHLLPTQEGMDDLPLLTMANQVLELLRSAERQRIREESWADLQPWMVRWQIDHLLAAGSGSNQPRLRFAPTLLPYSTLYHCWSEPVPQQVLPSEIILENASRGGFASMFEVLAAFDGACRLLDDPNHGLVACQKRALAAAKRQHPHKFDDIDFGGAGSGKIAMVLLPLLLMGGIVGIMALSDNLGQAIGLSLALLGVLGMLAMWLLR